MDACEALALSRVVFRHGVEFRRARNFRIVGETCRRIEKHCLGFTAVHSETVICFANERVDKACFYPHGGVAQNLTFKPRYSERPMPGTAIPQESMPSLAGGLIDMVRPWPR